MIFIRLLQSCQKRIQTIILAQVELFLQAVAGFFPPHRSDTADGLTLFHRFPALFQLSQCRLQSLHALHCLGRRAFVSALQQVEHVQEFLL